MIALTPRGFRRCRDLLQPDWRLTAKAVIALWALKSVLALGTDPMDYP
jgi:hypothetical protein